MSNAVSNSVSSGQEQENKSAKVPKSVYYQVQGYSLTCNVGVGTASQKLISVTTAVHPSQIKFLDRHGSVDPFIQLTGVEDVQTPMVKSCSMPGVTDAMNLRKTTRY
jgi:hypothetical protein